jgi:hypothetical protein
MRSPMKRGVAMKLGVMGILIGGPIYPNDRAADFLVGDVRVAFSVKIVLLPRAFRRSLDEFVSGL